MFKIARCARDVDQTGLTARVYCGPSSNTVEGDLVLDGNNNRSTARVLQLHLGLLKLNGSGCCQARSLAGRRAGVWSDS
jgi:hypothetical protein